MASQGAASQRVDQWLWFSRIVKSRTGAQALIERGKVRLNRQRLEKPSIAIKPGDVLTMSIGHRVRVFEIAAIGARRGPACEAQMLYKDLSEPVPAKVEGRPIYPSGNAVRMPGAGRPTKRERRQLDRIKQSI